MIATKFKKNISLLLIAVSTVLICSSTVHAENVLKMGGAGSALGTMKLLGEAFEKLHPDIRVHVLPSLGSTGGIKAVAKGDVAIGLSGRPLKDEEQKLGLVQIEFARTPFVFVANKDVRVSNVSTKELVEIYAGKKQTWPDGTRIRPVLRPRKETDTKIVESISPEMGQAVETALLREGMIITITDQENAATIEKVKGSVGASTLSQIISEKRPLKILSYNGVKPTIKALSDGSYPFVKPLYLITSPEKSAIVQKFIDFVWSPTGQKILEGNGNLPLKKK